MMLHALNLSSSLNDLSSQNTLYAPSEGTASHILATCAPDEAKCFLCVLGNSNIPVYITQLSYLRNCLVAVRINALLYLYPGTQL